MRRLVIVRPEPGASATARAAASMGLEPVVLPLFEIRPVAWNPPDPHACDAILLTSANAVRQAGPELAKLKGLTAHCVGEATARSAAEGGLSVGHTGNRGVEDLLAALPPGIRLLHLCGVHRKAIVSSAESIDERPVYESVKVSRSLDGLRDSVVTLHSPRAASALARLVLDRGSIAIAAISPETASAAGDGWEQVETASEPTDAALLAIASRLCNKRP